MYLYLNDIWRYVGSLCLIMNHNDADWSKYPVLPGWMVKIYGPAAVHDNSKTVSPCSQSWSTDMTIISACNIQSLPPFLQLSVPQVFIVKTHDSLSPHNKLTLHLDVSLWSNRLNLTTRWVCRVFIAGASAAVSCSHLDWVHACGLMWYCKKCCVYVA